MKRKIFLASLAMLAIVAIIVVSCNENEELEDFYSLDVTNRTPITKAPWPTMNLEQVKL